MHYFLGFLKNIIPNSWKNYYRYLRYSLLRRYSKFYGKTSNEIFTEIYQSNYWGDSESISGSGASLTQTQTLIQELENILRKYNIKSLLDIPCGDFNWMKEVDLAGITYQGGDIVKDLIIQNQNTFSQANHIEFEVFDLTKDHLPTADLILCRDCLVHLSYEDIFKVFRQVISSQSKYLLTTTFSNPNRLNYNIQTGNWRALNLQKAPFHFPQPIELVNEKCTEGNGEFEDKSIALWSIESLRNFHKY